jgi:hypothetical protein
LQGYRYGWDILDLNDPEQWETTLTPFVGTYAQTPIRTFFFGTHTFFAEVIDNNGYETRAVVVINIVPFTMERSVLVIDDWEEPGTPFGKNGGVTPSDDEHDAFWADVVSDVFDFVPAVDIWHMEPGSYTLPINVVAKYKTIIWNSRGAPNSETGSKLNDFIKFIHPDPRYQNPDEKLPPNLIDMFMDAGGHVLLCGENIMTMAINRRFTHAVTYPFIFRYELSGNQSGHYVDSNVGVWGIGEGSMAYDNCCLNVVDIAYLPNPGGLRKSPPSCDVTGVRIRDRRTEALRACIPIDGTYAFPRLDLRPEVAGFGKWYHESKIGLQCDIYNPPYFESLCNHLAELSPRRSCFQPMYGLECLNTSSSVYGAPVAFWTSRFATRIPPEGVPARSAVWGFEPVYFKPSQVKEALNVILFDEWKLTRKQ